MRNKENTFLLVCVLILLGFVVFKIITLVPENNQIQIQEKAEPQTMQQIINDCKNLDLFNTSYCFRDNIKTFFKYYNDGVKYYYDENGKAFLLNVSNLRISSSTNENLLDYLKENGGDCTEWSLLYKKLCESTKYNCATVDNGGVFHVFSGHKYAVLYNSTNYCKLDQLNIKCGENKERSYANE